MYLDAFCCLRDKALVYVSNFFVSTNLLKVGERQPSAPELNVSTKNKTMFPSFVTSLPSMKP